MMNHISKFSIIVTIYNKEKSIRRCLNSILAQSYDEWEAICVDDGSTDDSFSILEEYAKNDNRVIVVHQANSGIAAARNRGIKESNGEYICIVDADDYIKEDMLQNYNSVIGTVDADFYVMDYFRISGKSVKYKSTMHNQNEGLLDREKDIDQLRDYLSSISAVWNRAISKRFIEDNKLKFKDCFYADDEIFVMEMYALSNRIFYLKKAGYYYVDDGNSITHKYSDKSLDMWRDMYEHEIKLNIGSRDEYVKYLNSRLLSSIVILYVRYFDHQECNLSCKEKKMELEKIISQYPYSEAFKDYSFDYLSRAAKIVIKGETFNYRRLVLVSKIKRFRDVMTKMIGG